MIRIAIETLTVDLGQVHRIERRWVGADTMQQVDTMNAAVCEQQHVDLLIRTQTQRHDHALVLMALCQHFAVKLGVFRLKA